MTRAVKNANDCVARESCSIDVLRVRLSRPHPWRLVLDVFYPLWGLYFIQIETPLNHRT